jgi:peptide/nickel transport system substrate-binding protein
MNTPVAGGETPVITIPTPTSIPPTPTTPPRVLVVCTANEPQDLFPFGGRSPAKNHVIEALYDGPIDRRSYDYQAIILEKLTSLADGDARIEPVQVSEGDWIVNAA